MTRPKRLPPGDVLHQFLRYEPETGRLFWRESVPRPLFNCQRGYRIWHSKFAGTEAFTASDPRGYRRGMIKGQQCLAHRVVASMLWGDIGGQHIDHIDGDPSNNRPGNLRLASSTENHRNAARPSHNTSGQVGVVWCKRLGKWLSRIKVAGRSIHLATHDLYEDAVARRKLAEIEHGFHPNHGRESMIPSLIDERKSA